MYPMASYLTKHGSGLRFQMRVPRDLIPAFGSSPILLSLGRISASSARRVARILSGCVESRFTIVRVRGRAMADERDQLIRELEEMVLFSFDHMKELKRLHETEMEKAEYEHLRERIRAEDEKKALVTKATSSLQEVEKFIANLPDKSLQSQIDNLRTLISERIPIVAPAPVLPCLSETVGSFLNLCRKEGTAEKRVLTLERRIADFIEFAGDRPVDAYGLNDFQNYMDVLVRVPSNWSKLPQTRDKTLIQSAEYNDSLSVQKRHQTLAVAGIEANYISPLRGIFRRLSAEHRFHNPLGETKIIVSSKAKQSVQREPFSVEQLNIWFKSSAKASEPHLKWMPLLSVVTGARIAEMTFLQGKDIYEIQKGLWVADLTTDLAVAGKSTTKERKIKNKGSRRIMALHNCLVETGFIKYAKSKRPDDWLFPHLHKKKDGTLAKDPADSASKKMRQNLEKVGIHEKHVHVFHSTRHTAKDIMRIAKIEERTSDMQTGHVQKSISRTYGSKVLRPDEVEVLAEMQLPEGLDLSPYMKK